MKTTIRKALLKAVFLTTIVTGITGCSTTSFFSNNDSLDKIRPGMTQSEVSHILGKPKFRRFNYDIEEWEYRKWISNYDAVIIVRFDEGKVVAMDSFETPNNQQTGTVPTPPVPYPDNRPVRPQRLERMSDSEFSLFYKKVKDEPFSDEKDDMIRALSGSKRLTCKQCAQLLDFYSFSDEKLNVVRLFAPNIVDKENYKDIQKKFSSYFDKEDVKKIIGI